jgi:hypothetical protein
MDCLDLVQGRDQWRAIFSRVNEPSGSIKFWEVLE